MQKYIDFWNTESDTDILFGSDGKTWTWYQLFNIFKFNYYYNFYLITESETDKLFGSGDEDGDEIQFMPKDDLESDSDEVCLFVY